MESGAVTHVAILPSPGTGHLIPVLELGRRLVALHGLRVTVFVLGDDQPGLLFPSLPDALRLVRLPPVDPAAVPDTAAVVTGISLGLRSVLPSLRSALLEASPPPTALVVDVFGTDAFDVAGDLGIPRYVFFTSTAALLALMLYMPALDEEVAGEYVDLSDPIRVPGCTPIRPADVVDPMLDRGDDQYRWYLHQSSRFPLADAILLNTVEELEPVPLTALREHPALVRIPTPPLYPVGPVTRPATTIRDPEHEQTLAWLDAQPPGSVLFVSFGSGGTLSDEQTAELAWGLELSRQRFLWVTRRPTAGGDADAAFFDAAGGAGPDDPATYLPEGFAGRAEGRGLVVPSWVPQVEVLGHPAVGGFVTHGGWNSVLESVSAGVAMVVWPLYAEQKMNAAKLEEELGVAVRVRPEGGVVKRAEVERVVRLLMEGDQGKAMEAKVAELRDCFRKALAPGGSSQNSLSVLVDAWRQGTGKNLPEEVTTHA